MVVPIWADYWNGLTALLDWVYWPIPQINLAIGRICVCRIFKMDCCWDYPVYEISFARINNRSLPCHEPIFVREYMVCSLDIHNMILIASLAMDMMNRLKNRGDKINSISNRQSMGLSDILPNGSGVFLGDIALRYRWFILVSDNVFLRLP